MLYRNRFKIVDNFELHPTEKEIISVPNYFACSVEFVESHSGCPEWLRNLICRTPWTGTRKHRCVQVRTAFLNINEGMIGNFWHIDVDVPGSRFDEKVRHSAGYDDLRIWLIIFGQVSGTEFIDEPLFFPTIEDFSRVDYHAFSALVESSRPFQTIVVPSGNLIEYSSYDIHRGQVALRPGLRMGVSLFETDSDSFPADQINPSLSDSVSRDKR